MAREPSAMDRGFALGDLMSNPPDTMDELLQQAIQGEAHGPRASDREHALLQHQVDALFVAIRTLMHQSSDLTIRTQRMDADIIVNNRQLADLTRAVADQAKTGDERDAKLSARMTELAAGQAEMLRAIADSADVIKQVRDARTTGRVVSSVIRGAAALILALDIIGGGIVSSAHWLSSGTPPPSSP